MLSILFGAKRRSDRPDSPPLGPSYPVAPTPQATESPAAAGWPESTAAMDARRRDHGAVVVLRDFEEFSTRVAEVLGLGVANAKTRVHRTRLFLRQRLPACLMTNGDSAHESNAVRVRGEETGVLTSCDGLTD